MSGSRDGSPAGQRGDREGYHGDQPRSNGNGDEQHGPPEPGCYVIDVHRQRADGNNQHEIVQRLSGGRHPVGREAIGPRQPKKRRKHPTGKENQQKDGRTAVQEHQYERPHCADSQCEPAQPWQRPRLRQIGFITSPVRCDGRWGRDPCAAPCRRPAAPGRALPPYPSAPR